MKFIEKLKCKAASKKDLNKYYQSLPKEELIKRKSAQRNLYLTTTFCWVFALIATVVAAKMSDVLLVLYVGLVMSLLITTWVDYKGRVSLIDRIIKTK